MSLRPCFRDDATAIVRDRENQYRPPADNFADIAREWAAYLGIDISPEDVCEMMVLLKACRLKGETKRDSIVDLIAYAVDCRNAVEAAEVKPDDDTPPKLNDLSHTGYATVAKPSEGMRSYLDSFLAYERAKKRYGIYDPMAIRWAKCHTDGSPYVFLGGKPAAEVYAASHPGLVVREIV